MKKRILLGIFAVLIMAAMMMLFFGGCSKKQEQASPAAPDKIQFATSYDEALKLGQEKGQKVLLDFYTDWCQWCKKLDTETYVDPLIVELSKTIVFAKVNAEVDTLTARKYMVTGYPTLVLMNNDGSEIDRVAGYLPAPEFKETIDNYLNDIQTLNYYLRMADSGVTNELNYRIGGKYADRGAYPEAETYFNKVIAADPENKGGYTDSAMMSVADMNMRSKKYDEALAQFAKIKKQFAGSGLAIDAGIWIGIAYRQKGDTATAIKAFEDFIKENPTSPDTDYALQQINKMKNPSAEQKP
jgi:thioredoxin-like negative regulator of GroEL